MRKYIHLFSLTGKEGIKNFVCTLHLDNCVCFREPIIICVKNNENATFIINIRQSKVYTKSGVTFLLPKYSSTSMTFWRKVVKITMLN